MADSGSDSLDVPPVVSGAAPAAVVSGAAPGAVVSGAAPGAVVSGAAPVAVASVVSPDVSLSPSPHAPSSSTAVPTATSTCPRGVNRIGLVTFPVQFLRPIRQALRQGSAAIPPGCAVP